MIIISQKYYQIFNLAQTCVHINFRPEIPRDTKNLICGFFCRNEMVKFLTLILCADMYLAITLSRLDDFENACSAYLFTFGFVNIP
jgi:hypothetical protein